MTLPGDEGGRVLATPEDLTVIDVWATDQGPHQGSSPRYSVSAPGFYGYRISLDRVQDVLDDWYFGRGPFTRHGPKCSTILTREPVFAYERQGRPNRANVTMEQSYRVDAIEFVDAGHTPKNVLLRCHRTGATAPRAAWEELDAMTGLLGVRPALADKLESELAAARPPP